MTDVLAKIQIVLFDGKDEEYNAQMAKSKALAKAKVYEDAMLSSFNIGTDEAKIKQDTAQKLAKKRNIA